MVAQVRAKAADDDAATYSLDCVSSTVPANGHVTVRDIGNSFVHDVTTWTISTSMTQVRMRRACATARA